MDADDGVVRVSLVHYNSIAEVDRLVEALDEILPNA
jgi:selenocysteine lyase/cysteine desulfurase